MNVKFWRGFYFLSHVCRLSLIRLLLTTRIMIYEYNLCKKYNYEKQ